jgi:L-ascorbate metabolism protein UlaG (beta-lactamase superfamily)/N-acetylneuraminic acid mutarotase
MIEKAYMKRRTTVAALAAWTMLPQAIFLAAVLTLPSPGAAAAESLSLTNPIAISRAQTNVPSPWKLLAPLPVPRHDLQLVAWQGKLMAISGANDLTVSNVDCYNPATHAWSPQAPIPDRRGWFGAALLDNRIYCIGGKRIRAAPERRDSGDASPYEYRASLNIYDPAADRWSVGPPMRDPRAGCQAVALDGKLYVIGGSSPKFGFLDRVEIYDPATNAWMDGTALPDSREDLGAAATGGKLYAIGGVKHSVRGDVFIFDPKAGRWTTGAPMPTPRRSFAIVAEGPRLWCLGGVPAGGGYTNVVEIYDTLANEWSTGPALPQAKAWSGAAVLGALLYMVGGANQNAASKQYVWLGDVHALPLRRTNEIAITWWGNMSVEVNLGEVNLVFDPYIKPAEPRFQYIFVSHPHYDHCHEPTLRQLVPPGSPIEMLFAARGCFYASRVDGPNNWSDTPLSDLGFVRHGKARTLYPTYNDTVNSHIKKGELFDGPTEFTTGRIRVETFRSHEDPAPKKTSSGDTGALTGSFPNLGFLVTDLKTGRSFAHTGDIWNAYPEMEKMRGKVDVLFYPLGKLGIAEKTKMMDYIRPKIAIPTHYRLLEPDFPIPPLYLTDMPNMSDAEICKSEETIRKASLGNWYLSPADPHAEIATQREAFQGLTRVVELKAGTRYVLPANLDEFQGSTSGMAPRSADAESKDAKHTDR